MHQIRLFFTALQFFTRLPIPRWVGFDAAWLHQSSRYFPLVGVTVAAIAAGVYAAAALVLPAPVAALLSTGASIYATGAFHEDGFADMCDGFGGGMTRERVLEIMKDSRIGAYGAIGTICMLGVKCTALAMLPPVTAIAALFLAHPLSRLAATALIWRMDYARDEGKSKPMAQKMRTGEFAVAASTVLAAAAVLLRGGWLHWQAVLAAIVAASASTLWLAMKFQRRIGGYTGDCLGAVQQAAEAMIYLCVLGSLGQGALPCA
ncbi:adenosylcobinamide-GDP ribazoletransferase [Pseudoduganella ginsengisoli]|uniref:Adenosylcobinamide-GDP ribazoletransferase n=1 Tax=Pseudoduganella ginsengisoli TaxID=1462440 RepID=A0A6L6Q9B3_9BURK|nr:adenosylcobinamide-GDP ribazoletransferase [Pseudoduganella ginsengisoli]MTW06235.1 adenosylcobinamide-GDP ribazoletransferase [Pseudoduganella ginsengisoli]